MGDRAGTEIGEGALPATGVRGWPAAWPLAVLCLLASSRWLIEGTVPGTGSTGVTQAVGCAMAAGVAAIPGLSRRALAEARPRNAVGAWLGAALALSGPAIAAGVSDRYVNWNNMALALCLAPVVIAVAVSARGAGERDSLTARLWPGMVGVAALLLLVPEPGFGSLRFTAAMLLAPLLTGLGAAALPDASAEPLDAAVGVPVRWPWMALLTTAGLFGGMAMMAAHSAGAVTFSVSAAGLDALTALLSVIVLARVGPTRWSVQFLLVPLLSLLEGAVVLRPVLDARSWLAFVLLSVAAAYLWSLGRPAVSAADAVPGRTLT